MPAEFNFIFNQDGLEIFEGTAFKGLNGGRDEFWSDDADNEKFRFKTDNSSAYGALEEHQIVAIKFEEDPWDCWSVYCSASLDEALAQWNEAHREKWEARQNAI